MARELGMNPTKLGKLDNHKQEPWKLPLPQFIEEIYFKHFGQSSPDNVMSIEERVRLDNEKKLRKWPRRSAAPRHNEQVSVLDREHKHSGRLYLLVD